MNSKKDLTYYELYCGKEKEVNNTSELVWNVMVEDNGKIVVYNIFNGSVKFHNGLIDANKKYKDDNDFLDKIREELAYAYWSKNEYEITISSYPAYISKEEIKRISEADVKYRTWINIEYGKRVDVYTQVMLNWEAFKEYLITHRNLIPQK